MCLLKKFALLYLYLYKVFSRKGNVTLEKIYNTYAITIYCKCARANKILSIVLLIDLTMNFYPMIYIYIYSLPKTTSVSFPFSSFLFRSQHQHSIPGIPSSIYGHLLEYYTGFFFIICVQVCLPVALHRYFHFMFIFRWNIL